MENIETDPPNEYKIITINRDNNLNEFSFTEENNATALSIAISHFFDDGDETCHLFKLDKKMQKWGRIGIISND